MTFPTVTPTPGAAGLHAAHLARPKKKRTKKKLKREHPDDHALRVAHPDVVAFLTEAALGGRVARYYAAGPDTVTVHLAGPGGVFHPIDPVDLTIDDIVALADDIAVGTAYEAFDLPVAA